MQEGPKRGMSMSNPKRNIIDVRNRPSLKAYKGLFDPKINVLMKSHVIVKNCGANTSSPAIEMGVDKPAAMEQ
jgi:hypothetical protein